MSVTELNIVTIFTITYCTTFFVKLVKIMIFDEPIYHFASVRKLSLDREIFKKILVQKCGFFCVCFVIALYKFSLQYIKI